MRRYLAVRPRPTRVIVRDAILNVRALSALGYLWQRATRSRVGAGRGVVLVTLGAAVFSLGVESLQVFLPWRHSSLSR